MATAWRGLGAEVTLVENGDRLLPPLEPAAGRRWPRHCGPRVWTCGWGTR
ncbi:NAD-binding protein [Blastococcus brunescens]|uniref:NAD-binding protein n=1 Tax=Blastococcus brunescens TaxID=1564165 RepID=A0ABZ1B3E1_9ACTN|nr:NAD-binding protein [Blastococcus sp. BMG 8361]WRL65321.1 NAD-binding protein [Blastococcus sp. BMG 8361]